MVLELELLFQNNPVYIEVIESLNKVALYAVGNGDFNVSIVHSKRLVLG